MASEAEEQLRLKTVAALRRRWPDARIIHELQLEQGGVRIDLAAVTQDRIVVAELKSERDVLKRLKRQMRVALRRCDEVWVVVAERHAPEAGKLWRWPDRSAAADETQHAEAIDAYRVLHRATLWVDRGTEDLWRAKPGWDGGANVVDPRQRFDLLWASEMRDALGLHFGGAAIPGSLSRTARHRSTAHAVEWMNGREIRLAVCRQLRARPFPRADAPCEPRLETLGGREDAA